MAERADRDASTSGLTRIRVGVGAMVFNDSGEVFLARRGPQARNERNTWEFPGGTVEIGERLDAAIQREFLEEFGMQIAITRLMHVVDHILPDEQQHWIAPTFLARHTAGAPEIREPDKCTAIGWFSLAALPAPLSMVSQEDLRIYRTQQPDLPVVALDHLQLAMPAGLEDQARAFYAGILGLVEVPKPPELRARGGCWFAGPGFQLHLGIETPFQPARKAHPALRVVDLTAYQARLLAAGIEVTPDTTVPGVQRFYIADPFGNRIECIQEGQGFSQSIELPLQPA